MPVEETLLSESTDQFHTRPAYNAGEHRWGHGGAAILDYLVVADGQYYPSRIEGNAKTDFISRSASMPILTASYLAF
jgi:lipopolysaccharide transport system ATP-binding protein